MRQVETEEMQCFTAEMKVGDSSWVIDDGSPERTGEIYSLLDAVQKKFSGSGNVKVDIDLEGEKECSWSFYIEEGAESDKLEEKLDSIVEKDWS